jgi:hypothetical protein
LSKVTPPRIDTPGKKIKRDFEKPSSESPPVVEEGIGEVKTGVFQRPLKTVR